MRPWEVCIGAMLGCSIKALEWLLGGFVFCFFWLDGAGSQHETSRSNAAVHSNGNGWAGEVVRLAFPRHRRGHLLHTVAGDGPE